MKKEVEKTAEVLLPTFFLFLLTLAFSHKSREAIHKRDNETCQSCGAKNVPLEASHTNHSRNNPNYDDPSNGRLLCVDCHLKEHKDAVGNSVEKNGLTESQNLWAIGKISERTHTKV